MTINLLDTKTKYGPRILTELSLQLCLKDFVKKGNIVLDIGANIGGLSIALSRMVGEDGKVYSFEPNTFVLPKLKRDIIANNAKNVQIISKGIWSKSLENFPFFCDNGPYGAASSLKSKTENSKEIQIEVISLDDFCDENNIIPNVIKIDAEGAEYEIILGAENTIKKHHPIIAFEYIPQNDDRFDVLEKILSFGYDCYDVNLYQKVDRNYYKTNAKPSPYNIIAVPFSDHTYSNLRLEPYTQQEINHSFSSDLISLEFPGRYVVIFDFTSPSIDSLFASLKITKENGEVLSISKTVLQILREHLCTHAIFEIEKSTEIKCEILGDNLDGFNFKKVIINRILY